MWTDELALMCTQSLQAPCAKSV